MGWDGENGEIIVKSISIHSFLFFCGLDRLGVCVCRWCDAMRFDATQCKNKRGKGEGKDMVGLALALVTRKKAFFT